VTRMKRRWQESTLGRSVRVLSRGDQRKIVLIAFVQIFMSFLDLLGVLIIGLLGAVAVSGIASSKPGTRVSEVLRFLHISGASFQTQASILGALAVVLLVGRTIFSIFFTRRILFFLSRRGASISAKLVSRMLSQPLLMIQARTTQDTLYSVTRGVEYLALNVLATGVVLIADISLLIVMGLGLFIVDPLTAVVTIAIFAVIGFSLYRLLHIRAGELGLKSSRLIIESNEKIVEVFGSYRESIVRNRRDYYARGIGKQRILLADTMAEISFMPYISKYVIETSVVLGALLVGAVQFVFQDAAHAVATIAIFLAAGTRIAPSVLRVQQGSLQIRGGIGQAGPTLDLIETLGNAKLVENVDDTVDAIHDGFVASIEVENVSFAYPGKRHPAIRNVTLSIPIGASIAIVGPSGAGKTTLIDILLGVLPPDEGRVVVSGLPPLGAVAKWPGALSYVPQDVVIANGSVRENVALGYPSEAATDELVMSALKIACLDDFVSELPQGVDTPVGERGAKMSGGQRQRLGIARAMFTKPHLLVLDEATSSLDGETEASISAAIHALRGSTTVLMIAHRLSTVRNADTVIYMANGVVHSVGTFEEVRAAVPDFDRQAKLMGL
jgi:ABC-type multidrug transport system fused ATPase/permease subunit